MGPDRHEWLPPAASMPTWIGTALAPKENNSAALASASDTSDEVRMFIPQGRMAGLAQPKHNARQVSIYLI